MSWFVRPYTEGDAAPLASLLRRSVSVLGPNDYGQEQVAVWLKRLPDAETLHDLSCDGRTVLVVVDESGQQVAFTHLEADGYIHYLYAAPEIAGLGAGGLLLDELEKLARERKVARLYVEASESARRLFLRKGYSELQRRDFLLYGVAVHNYAMEKRFPS